MHANFSSRLLYVFYAMYYRMYISARQTCSMPMVHASFQTPKTVGNVKVVENVRVDVTESNSRGRVPFANEVNAAFCVLPVKSAI